MTPDNYTNREFFLEVGDEHELYVHDWGNKDAKTVVLWLHGGPGSSCSDSAKAHFDPTKQRAIFFDQRGAGKSLPTGSLEHNTTQDLVADITKILDKLNLEQVVLIGGSWGSCLALAYALAHPKRVKAMVLHGIFTGSKAEIDWLDQGLFKTFYPDAWQNFLDATPKSHQTDPTTYHAKRALSDDPEASKKSAYVYGSLEGNVIQLDDRFQPWDYETYAPSGMRIEIHYMQHDCFMPDRHILDNAHKLTMPVYLVQGRYDMVCPPSAAHELKKALPNGKLIYTINGHKPEHEAWNVMETILAFETN